MFVACAAFRAVEGKVLCLIVDIEPATTSGATHVLVHGATTVILSSGISEIIESSPVSRVLRTALVCHTVPHVPLSPRIASFCGKTHIHRKCIVSFVSYYSPIWASRTGLLSLITRSIVLRDTPNILAISSIVFPCAKRVLTPRISSHGIATRPRRRGVPCGGSIIIVITTTCV